MRLSHKEVFTTKVYSGKSQIFLNRCKVKQVRSVISNFSVVGVRSMWIVWMAYYRWRDKALWHNEHYLQLAPHSLQTKNREIQKISRARSEFLLLSEFGIRRENEVSREMAADCSDRTQWRVTNVTISTSFLEYIARDVSTVWFVVFDRHAD